MPSLPSHRFAVPVSLLCAALCLATALPVHSQSDAVPGAEAAGDYALPAGPLSSALREIARVSGRAVRFDDADVRGRQAPTLQGRLAAVEAVQRAISQSGLSMRSAAGGELVVFVPWLDAVRAVARRDQAETEFKADRSDTTSRSGNSLMDTPAAVTVITSKVLETQQATSITEALANASGVVVQQNLQGTPSFSVRGYGDTYNNLSTNVMSNGINDPDGTSTSVYGVERIEVLKGPQAILIGARTLGGAVNIVTKKPQAETAGQVSLQYGSHNDRTVAADVGGALNKDDRLSARVIGAWTGAGGSEGDYDGRRDRFVMPQIRWKDENTDLLVGASYDKQRNPANRYGFAWDGRIQPLPGRRLGRANDGIDTKNRRLFYSFEQRIGEHFTLVSSAERALGTVDLHLQSPLVVLSPAAALALYSPLSNLTDFNSTSGDHYLRSEFATGLLQHTLSTGLSHYQGTQQIDAYQGGMAPVSLYTASADDFPAMASRAVPSDIYRIGYKQFGVYAQDLIGWKDTTLLLSVRRSRYEEGPSSTTIAGNANAAVSAKQTSDKTLPGVGLVQRLAPWASVYASYTQGFSPSFGNACDGGAPKPRSSENREIGAKFDLADGRLGITTAGFEIKDKNAAEYNIALRCYTFVPSQVTKGFELDLQGRLAPGWNTIFNYTYSKTDNPSNPARYFPGKPRNSASLWSTYDFQDGVLARWGLGLGVTARSDSPGTNSNSYRLPGGASVDTRVYYRQDRWRLTLGVKNVFDRLLYGAATTETYIPVLDGRTFMATWQWNVL
ncbi:TonB-dependent siderophore receptor [Xanthomonas theicola]|uniref:TonB-dependent siderophore receptor n=1 Tax=Xanthomonas theicola TaxID=56464 RepID=A0A2S6ZCF8_9XANT|nr:TonB-dependent receptor [Xanthomonas theicola]PPT87755.1 hypothetical protein XthCFBP4691_15170 [Xanthomonas theicola]QNH23917.1 TonB-dependent receptor [Xanthomonas theicola]